MMEANAGSPEHAIEFFHGYTYSGHPVACAAAIATLELFKQENLFERAGEMGKVLGDAMHSALQGPAQRDRHPQPGPGRRRWSWRRSPARRASAPTTSSWTASTTACWCAPAGENW